MMIQGCDIPDVDIVVQWKAPENLSSWVQRAGHAAQGDGRQGLVVMIVEKSAFEIAAFPQASAGHSTTSATWGVGQGCGTASLGRGQACTTAVKQGLEYATAHGQKRGMFGGEHDTIEKLNETHITLDMLWDAKGEGIYFYIQTTNCCWLVLRMVFQNAPLGRRILISLNVCWHLLKDVDPALCCNLCNSNLFDRVCPSKPKQVVRQRARNCVAPVNSVQSALYGWRWEMKAKYWPHSLWGPQAILNDDACELLSSVGPVDSVVFLSSVLKEGWEWWDKLGSELYAFMHSLTIPPLPMKASRGVKRRPVQETDDHPVPGPSTSTKRAHTGATQPNQSVPPASSNSTQTSSARPHKGRRQDPAPLAFLPSLYEGFFSQLANTPK